MLRETVCKERTVLYVPLYLNFATNHIHTHAWRDAQQTRNGSSTKLTSLVWFPRRACSSRQTSLVLCPRRVSAETISMAFPENVEENNRLSYSGWAKRTLLPNGCRERCGHTCADED